MNGSVPRIGRLTFTIHVVVAAVLGVVYFLLVFGGTPPLGVPEIGDSAPVAASLAAMFFGMGAVTSYYGARAKRWEQVDFIVRGEIVYLVLQTLVNIYTFTLPASPVLVSVISLVLSIAFLVLFALTWVRRPTQA